jgi:hypothetical protein
MEDQDDVQRNFPQPCESLVDQAMEVDDMVCDVLICCSLSSPFFSSLRSTHHPTNLLRWYRANYPTVVLKTIMYVYTHPGIDVIADVLLPIFQAMDIDAEPSYLYPVTQTPVRLPEETWEFSPSLSQNQINPEFSYPAIPSRHPNLFTQLPPVDSTCFDPEAGSHLEHYEASEPHPPKVFNHPIFLELVCRIVHADSNL